MYRDLRSLKDVWDKIQYILTKKQKRKSVVVFFLILIGAMVETLGVSAIIPLVQAMLDPDLLLHNEKFSKYFAALHIETGMQLIGTISAVVIVIYILKNAYLIMLSYARVRFAVSIKQELSVRIMRSYMKRNYSYFINMKTADLIRGVGYDCSGVHEVISQGFKLLTEGLTALCICIFIFYTDFVMAGGIVLILAVLLLFLITIFRKKMKQLGDYTRECTSESNRYLYEAFQGIKDVFIFKGRNYYANQYDKYYGEQQKTDAYRSVAAESPSYLIEAVCVSGLIIIVGIKLLMGVDTNQFIPQLAAFAVAAFRVLPSIGRISSSFNQFVYMCPTVTAVYDNLKEVELYEKLGEGTEVSEDSDEVLQFTRNIVFQNICWKYPKTDEYVVRNINFTIKKGTSVGLIGQSGSGKSTLADILLGLFCPQEGKVLVDGVNIFENLEKWRNTVSYVPQTVFLRDDTIRNNIAFGVEEDKIDDDKIWNAIRMAQLEELIHTLPEGINTHMGERGIRFSGGQKQRVAIARALYNNPDILVLDEATSALDNETESAVMEAIEALHGQKTLVIVAHRLSTIRKCDEIYEVTDGSIFKRTYEEVFGDES